MTSQIYYACIMFVRYLMLHNDDEEGEDLPRKLRKIFTSGNRDVGYTQGRRGSFQMWMLPSLLIHTLVSNQINIGWLHQFVILFKILSNLKLFKCLELLGNWHLPTRSLGTGPHHISFNDF